MRKSPILARFLSILISFFLGTQTALGAMGESNLWKSRRQSLQTGSHPLGHQYAALPPSLNPTLPADLPKIQSVLTRSTAWKHALRNPAAVLPPDFRTLLESVSPAHGRFLEIHLSKTSRKPPVLLVQDVHLNVEAQKNIAAMIQNLIDRNHLGAVGVEGAFAPIDFTRLRSFEDKGVTKTVADAFLENKLLAAPSYVGITSARPLPPFIGVDDKLAYSANVSAYRKSGEIKDDAQTELTRRAREIRDRQKKVYSPALLALDRITSAYHKGDLPLGSYVKNLSTYGSLDLTLEQFLQAYEMESSLDFDRVEEERRLLLENLVQKLTGGDVDALLSASLAYRAGALGFGDYYAHLKSLCEKHRVSLQNYPAFDDYIRYVLLADGIDAEKLFEEVGRREDSVFNRLARTDEQKKLVRENHRLQLLRKLIEFQLTPREWEEYRNSNQMGDPEFRVFEDFYRFADIRSEKMIENLGRLNNPAPTVLVAGGFHSPRLTELLKKKDLSFAVVSPTLTERDGEPSNGYLSVFSREKTPLDRLFAGEKLFIKPQHGMVSDKGTRVRVESVVTVENELKNPSSFVPPAGITLTASLRGVFKIVLDKADAVFMTTNRKVGGFLIRGKSVVGNIWFASRSWDKTAVLDYAEHLGMNPNTSREINIRALKDELAAKRRELGDLFFEILANISKMNLDVETIREAFSNRSGDLSRIQGDIRKTLIGLALLRGNEQQFIDLNFHETEDGGICKISVAELLRAYNKWVEKLPFRPFDMYSERYSSNHFFAVLETEDGPGKRKRIAIDAASTQIFGESENPVTVGEYFEYKDSLSTVMQNRSLGKSSYKKREEFLRSRYRSIQNKLSPFNSPSFVSAKGFLIAGASHPSLWNAVTLIALAVVFSTMILYFWRAGTVEIGPEKARTDPVLKFKTWIRDGPRNSVVKITDDRQSQSGGSAFVIAKTENAVYLLTNAHVVGYRERMFVEIPGTNLSAQANVVAVANRLPNWENWDLALLRIPADNPGLSDRFVPVDLADESDLASSRPFPGAVYSGYEKRPRKTDYFEDGKRFKNRTKNYELKTARNGDSGSPYFIWADRADRAKAAGIVSGVGGTEYIPLTVTTLKEALLSSTLTDHYPDKSPRRFLVDESEAASYLSFISLLEKRESGESYAPLAANMRDKKDREAWGENSWRYRLTTIFWRSVVEVPYFLPLYFLSVVVPGVPGMAVAALATVPTAKYFADAHTDHTESERALLFWIGLGFGLAFLAPGLLAQAGRYDWLANPESSILFHVASHAGYNALALLFGWVVASRGKDTDDPDMTTLFTDLTDPKNESTRLKAAFRLRVGVSKGRYVQSLEDRHLRAILNVFYAAKESTSVQIHKLMTALLEKRPDLFTAEVFFELCQILIKDVISLKSKPDPIDGGEKIGLFLSLLEDLGRKPAFVSGLDQHDLDKLASLLDQKEAAPARDALLRLFIAVVRDSNASKNLSGAHFAALLRTYEHLKNRGGTDDITYELRQALFHLTSFVPSPLHAARFLEAMMNEDFYFEDDYSIWRQRLMNAFRPERSSKEILEKVAEFFYSDHPSSSTESEEKIAMDRQKAGMEFLKRLVMVDSSDSDFHLKEKTEWTNDYLNDSPIMEFYIIYLLWLLWTLSPPNEKVFDKKVQSSFSNLFEALKEYEAVPLEFNGSPDAFALIKKVFREDGRNRITRKLSIANDALSRLKKGLRFNVWWEDESPRIELIEDPPVAGAWKINERWFGTNAVKAAPWTESTAVLLLLVLIGATLPVFLPEGGIPNGLIRLAAGLFVNVLFTVGHWSGVYENVGPQGPPPFRDFAGWGDRLSAWEKLHSAGLAFHLPLIFVFALHPLLSLPVLIPAVTASFFWAVYRHHRRNTTPAVRSSAANEPSISHQMRDRPSEDDVMEEPLSFLDGRIQFQAVADGFGKNGAATASRTAIQTLRNHFENLFEKEIGKKIVTAPQLSGFLREAMRRANDAVVREQGKTALSALLTWRDPEGNLHLFGAQAGDTRLFYQVDGGELNALTASNIHGKGVHQVDLDPSVPSVIKEFFDREAALDEMASLAFADENLRDRFHKRHFVDNELGGIYAPIVYHKIIRPGVRVTLLGSSDGITDVLKKSEIAETLRSSKTPEGAIQTLFDRTDRSKPLLDGLREETSPLRVVYDFIRKNYIPFTIPDAPDDASHNILSEVGRFLQDKTVYPYGNTLYLFAEGVEPSIDQELKEQRLRLKNWREQVEINEALREFLGEIDLPRAEKLPIKDLKALHTKMGDFFMKKDLTAFFNGEEGDAGERDQLIRELREGIAALRVAAEKLPEPAPSRFDENELNTVKAALRELKEIVRQRGFIRAKVDDRAAFVMFIDPPRPLAAWRPDDEAGDGKNDQERSLHKRLTDLGKRIESGETSLIKPDSFALVFATLETTAISPDVKRAAIDLFRSMIINSKGQDIFLKDLKYIRRLESLSRNNQSRSIALEALILCYLALPPRAVNRLHSALERAVGRGRKSYRPFIEPVQFLRSLETVLSHPTDEGPLINISRRADNIFNLIWPDEIWNHMPFDERIVKDIVGFLEQKNRLATEFALRFLKMAFLNNYEWRLLEPSYFEKLISVRAKTRSGTGRAERDAGAILDAFAQSFVSLPAQDEFDLETRHDLYGADPGPELDQIAETIDTLLIFYQHAILSQYSALEFETDDKTDELIDSAGPEHLILMIKFYLSRLIGSVVEGSENQEKEANILSVASDRFLGYLKAFYDGLLIPQNEEFSTMIAANRNLDMNDEKDRKKLAFLVLEAKMIELNRTLEEIEEYRDVKIAHTFVLKRGNLAVVQFVPKAKRFARDPKELLLEKFPADRGKDLWPHWLGERMARTLEANNLPLRFNERDLYDDLGYALRELMKNGGQALSNKYSLPFETALLGVDLDFNMEGGDLIIEVRNGVPLDRKDYSKENLDRFHSILDVMLELARSPTSRLDGSQFENPDFPLKTGEVLTFSDTAPIAGIRSPRGRDEIEKTVRLIKELSGKLERGLELSTDDVFNLMTARFFSTKIKSFINAHFAALDEAGALRPLYDVKTRNAGYALYKIRRFADKNGIEFSIEEIKTETVFRLRIPSDKFRVTAGLQQSPGQATIPALALLADIIGVWIGMKKGAGGAWYMNKGYRAETYGMGFLTLLSAVWVSADPSISIWVTAVVAVGLLLIVFPTAHLFFGREAFVRLGLSVDWHKINAINSFYTVGIIATFLMSKTVYLQPIVSDPLFARIPLVVFSFFLWKWIGEKHKKIDKVKAPLHPSAEKELIDAIFRANAKVSINYPVYSVPLFVRHLIVTLVFDAALVLTAITPVFLITPLELFVFLGNRFVYRNLRASTKRLMRFLETPRLTNPSLELKKGRSGMDNLIRLFQYRKDQNTARLLLYHIANDLPIDVGLLRLREDGGITSTPEGDISDYISANILGLIDEQTRLEHVKPDRTALHAVLMELSYFIFYILTGDNDRLFAGSQRALAQTWKTGPAPVVVYEFVQDRIPHKINDRIQSSLRKAESDKDGASIRTAFIVSNEQEGRISNETKLKLREAGGVLVTEEERMTVDTLIHKSLETGPDGTSFLTQSDLKQAEFEFLFPNETAVDDIRAFLSSHALIERLRVFKFLTQTLNPLTIEFRADDGLESLDKKWELIKQSA